MRASVNKRHHIKLFVSMLTTYGYTLMGGSLFEPALKHAPIQWWNVFGASIALAMQGAAVYLAPQGEKDDE